MVTIAKMSKLFGKRLYDRQGNEYKLTNIIQDNNTGKVKELVFSDKDGRGSKRRSDGKVYPDKHSNRDIILAGLRSKRKRYEEDYDGHIDFFGDDEDDYEFEDGNPLDFIEDEYRGRRDFGTHTRRARYGTYVSPSYREFEPLIEDDLGGPNSKSKDIEITIRVKR